MKPSNRETQDQVLHKVRDIINEHWTKGYWAKTAGGADVLPGDPQANCWCIRGAVAKAVGGMYEILLDDVETRLKEQVPPKYYGLPGDHKLVQMNDHPDTTKEDMLALIDKALAT